MGNFPGCTVPTTTFYTWLGRLRVPVCKTWPVVFDWIIQVLIMIIMEVKKTEENQWLGVPHEEEMDWTSTKF